MPRSILPLPPLLSATLHGRALAACARAARTALVFAALLLGGAAWAAQYRLTTHATGDMGYFDIDGVFSQPGPAGAGPYALRVVTEFADPWVWVAADGQRVTIHSYNARLRVELEVAGALYTAQQDNAGISLDYFPDLDGRPFNDLRYAVYFSPASRGTDVLLNQRLLIPPARLSLADLLRPVSLSSPDIQSAQFDMALLVMLDDYDDVLGTAGGEATAFTYRMAPVPEPAGYALVLLGCATLVARMRLAPRSRRR